MLNMLNKKDKIAISFGISLIVASLVLLSSNYINEKINNAYSYMNNLLLESEEVYEIQEEVENIEESTSSFVNAMTMPSNKPTESYYIGNLKIPKINLNRGFTSIDSPYNTVSQNVEVVKGSNYPNIQKGNFILAAHSGSSYLAYFKDLYQLTIGDKAYITYQDVLYKYKIVNIYEQEKTGKIAIYRNFQKTCLTLVTCTKDSKTKQTIYILELESTTNI